MIVPTQLQNPEFKFFLVKPNCKFPAENGWNKDKCYPFFHTTFMAHQGNYGVLSGHGQLVIIDFDDWSYWNLKQAMLPQTFTVRTAKKRAYHYYYILKGEMFKTIGIDIGEKRVCDVMGHNGRCVGPGSMIDGKGYEIAVNVPIREIDLATIESIFEFRGRKLKEWKGSCKLQPEKVEQAIKVLLHNKIARNGERHFCCPFHLSAGRNCLYLADDGHLHCFHCGRHFSNVHNFVNELEEFRRIVI